MNKEWSIEIERVVSEFDADKVHKVMKLLNWHWFDYKGIPDSAAIRYELRGLIDSTINHMIEEGTDTFSIKSRGFYVIVNRYWDTDKLFISVSFEVTTIDNHN